MMFICVNIIREYTFCKLENPFFFIGRSSNQMGILWAYIMGFICPNWKLYIYPMAIERFVNRKITILIQGLRFFVCFGEIIKVSVLCVCVCVFSSINHSNTSSLQHVYPDSIVEFRELIACALPPLCTFGNGVNARLLLCGGRGRT